MYASFQNTLDLNAFETVSCLMQYTQKNRLGELTFEEIEKVATVSTEYSKGNLSTTWMVNVLEPLGF